MSHILLFCIRHLARENKSASQATLGRITSKFERPNQLNSRYKLAIKLLTSAILLSGTILSKSARAKKPFESYTTIPIPGTSFSYTAGSNNYTFGSGDDLQLESITADGGTIYTPQELADQIFIRRVDNALVSGDRCNIFVERGTGDFDAESSFPNEGGDCSVAEVLRDLIVNRGVLDVFSNEAASGSENPNNIERVDFVFSQGIVASTDPTQLDEAGHIVMEKSGNNPVKVAAITAIDGAGNPTAFKPTRVTINSSDYGRTGANINNNFLVDPSTSGGVSNPEYDRQSNEQVGGVLVTLEDFGIGAGEVYYGFAMFGTDVPDATDLLQPQNFPRNTPHGVGNTGGADWQGGMGGFWYSDEYEPGNLLLSGQVFEDTNDSDLLENNKPRLNDISVSIYLDDGDDAFETDGSDVLIGTTETNLGRYNFSNLAPNQKYWVRVDPDDVDLNGYSYGGGDVVADQVNPRLVSITTQEVANINFPFDVDAPESIDGLNVCYLVADGHTGPENSARDLLTKLNRVTGAEAAVGDGTGTNDIEAIAFDAVNNILYAGNAGQFGVIDLSTGVFSRIGGTNFGDIDGLAIDPFSREIYASIRLASGALDQLIKIDPATGTRVADAFGTGVDTIDIAAISGLTDIDDITVDPQTGQIYGVANNNGGNDTLVTITPSPSGASTNSVGTLGVQDVEGFSSFFDGSRFFGTTGSSSVSQNPDSFYRIDVDTGNSIYNFRLGINFGGGVTTDYEAVDCDTLGFNTLSGNVFNDLNVNGVFDGSDTATSNVTVQLYRDRNGDGVLDDNDDVTGDGVLDQADLLASQETDGNGAYSFQFNAIGAFVVQVDPADLPSGVNFTTNGGQNLQTADFANAIGTSITDRNLGYEVTIDLGDAPDTYGTDLTANNSSNSSDPVGASHIIFNELYLGTTIPDGDTDGFVDGTDDNNNATDDDATTGTGNGDDEDNFTLPTLTQGNTSYTIPAANITATNNTGQVATLHAWIDFNQDGVFQDSEHTSTTVNDNTNNANPTANLTWNSITVNNSGTTYARFRLTTDNTISAITPGGAAGDGEVEDYLMTIATSSANTISGSVFEDFGGGTTENNTKEAGENALGNITVNLYLDDGDGIFNATTDTLVDTTASDSTDGTYSFEVNNNGTYLVVLDHLDNDAPNLNISLPDRTVHLVTIAGASVVEQDFPYDPVGQSFDACPFDAFLFQTNPSDAYTITLVTGSDVREAVDIGNRHINGIGFNPLNSFIYGSNSTDQDGTISRVDSNYDVATLGPIVGLPTGVNFFVGDVSPDGKLYFRQGQNLRIIDTNPSSSTYLKYETLSLSQNISITDFAFSPVDGQIYTVANDNKNLYRINPSTGAVENLGNTGITGSSTFGAQFYDRAGFLYLSRNQDGNIFRVDTRNPASINATSVEFSLGPLSNINDGARCYQAPVEIDFGDAPESYGTSLSNDGARHDISQGTPLYLGSTPPDDEIDGQVSDAANGDGDDEDGLNLPSLTQGATSYTIPATNITATNNTGSSATLHAWIDFNNNGTFEDTEYASTTVNDSTNDGNPNGDLVWNSITPGSTLNSYARFRLTTDSSINATTPAGAAGDGEVEDYQIPLANPNQTIVETSSCADLGGTLSGNNLFTPLDNGTFGVEDGSPDQSPAAGADPYPGVVSGGNYDNFYNIDHGDYGYVANAQTTRNSAQHEGITDPVYGVTGRFFASDPDTDTPTLTTTLTGLTPNQFYEYSFWAANSEFSQTSSNNNVNVTINGQEIYSTGELPAILDTLEWKKHTVSFTNGASTSITIDLQSTETGASGNDFYLDNIELRSCNFTVDYGDLPPSYGDAIHTTIPTSPNVYLGTVVPDGETATPLGGDNGVGADGDDDNQATNDEDAFSSLSDVPTSGTYDLNDIPVVNTTGGDVILHGWIDFDRDGQFAATEHQSVTVSNGATTADLSWSIPLGTTEGDTYARFRITPDTLTLDNAGTSDLDERSQDAVINGEVEDYQLAITRNLLCPTARADLWFANDESGSVNTSEFEDSLDFIYQVSDQFEYGETAGIKAGIIGWASNTPTAARNHIIIPITDSFGDPDDTGLIGDGNINTDGDNQGVREEYTAKVVTSSGTRLDRATNYLADLIIAGAANGARANTPQVAIILTDANSGQITSSSSGGGINWTLAAEKLRVDAGAAIILIIIDDAADAYTANNNNEQAIINNVVGDNGQLLVVPTYTEAADATQGYVELAAQSVCDSTNPVSTDPELLLTKRITAINPGQTGEVTFSDFVDDESDSDNNAKWPNSTDDGGTFTNSYTVGTTNGGEVIPGDILEYSIYYLSSGEETASNVLVCDLIPANTELVTNDFDTVTPAPGGTPGLERGLVIESNGTLQSLTNDQDGDRGYYFPPGIEPSTVFPNVQCSDSNLPNTNGAIVVNLGDVPRATASGDPIGSFGFIRFRARVK